ncbi:GAF and ANTAR domain-containing protein [Aeromicrobium ginsengisoli]|uniref:ANTAR domain-containing protein n=1 Tax=Aeromicrobium ginsengisoli TaxID=363867 RepID=A0A5M4FI42_9ACTN|nr:GAF and ANTAR domain-containing protein [Aeromicrobium ginsengisoli]KAA1399846.1 ANTAR domain-containing protein [Aeromicrobium ginsengisoli]
MDEPLHDSIRRLAEALRPGDFDTTLHAITTAAVEVLPDVDYASITVKHADETIDTVAPTDDLVLDLDAKQYELREGPCYDAAVKTAHVISPEIATDERFPAYGPYVVSKGIHAQAGLRLFDAPASQGALNIYSHRAGAFEDFATLADLFSHQAAVAINYAREIDDLNDALNTRTTIGQAVGIIMERYELNDERAFAFLTRLSQHRNVKLRLIAAEIVEDVERRRN